MNNTKLIFLTGPSGVGKTSIIEQLEKDHAPIIHCRSFDKEVVIPINPQEGWQRISCIEWTQAVAKEQSIGTLILDMQCNIEYVLEAIQESGLTDSEIVLVTCSTEVMKQRLQIRGQLDLFTDDMVNWKNYLEGQARENDLRIIDTSSLSIQEGADKVLASS